MSDALARRVRIELRRCMAAVEHGSPKDFWVWRLTRLLNALELCAGQVRDAIRELE